MKNILKIVAAVYLLLGHAVLALEFTNVQDTILEFEGDNPRSPDTDPNWRPFSGQVLTDGGSQWFHMELVLDLESGEQVHAPLALGISLMGVYDFYWDGELIGSNLYQGASANRLSRVLVPVRNLTPGRHIIRMRIKTPGMKMGDPLDLYIRPAAVKSDFFGVHPSVISTFFVATAGLFTGCYLFLLWHSGGARPGLFTAICVSFSIVALILLQEGRFLFSYPYGWQPFIDNLIPPFAALTILLLPWFTITRLQLEPRALWMVGIAIVLGFSFIDIKGVDHDIRALVLLSISLLGMATFAWRRGKKSAQLFVSGFALALAGLWLDPDQKHLFLVVIIILLAVDLGIDIKRRASDAARHALVSERLRADLIKRNIQPHFLMNSLTALMEWVETAPEAAVEFIDGLATEFRMLSEFSERSSISMAEELKLCEIHLNLMAKRLDATFAFETSTVDRDALIPPGLFHTLLENALTHNAYAGQNIGFELDYKNQNGTMCYTLITPICAQQSNALGTGTGTRYVQARLEEFCGNAFRFSSEPIGSQWITTIEIEQFKR